MSDEAATDASAPKHSVLVIEDDPPVQRFLRLTLSNHNYKVIEATTGESGLRHAANDQPDLIILDLGLPDVDGLEVTRRIREWSAIPIIVVSARGKDQDKVVALDAGADDYLTKPFSVTELLARVRVAMRHTAAANKDTGDPVFKVGDLTVDLSRHQVLVAGKPVHLTRNEFRLLAALAKHAGRVMTHRQLLHDVWGPGAGDESQYLRVYMNQLRHKIELDPGQPKYLLTEVGVGYRLVSET
jgi:two-component system, OmpR family, KDP operon response regulator KdpE